jgi:hypothetical protein
MYIVKCTYIYLLYIPTYLYILYVCGLSRQVNQLQFHYLSYEHLKKYPIHEDFHHLQILRLSQG